MANKYWNSSTRIYWETWRKILEEIAERNIRGNRKGRGKETAAFCYMAYGTNLFNYLCIYNFEKNKN